MYISKSFIMSSKVGFKIKISVFRKEILSSDEQKNKKY